MSKDFWTTLKKAESAIDDVLHNRVKSVPKILKTEHGRSFLVSELIPDEVYQFADSCGNFFISDVIKNLTVAAQERKLIINFSIHKRWFSSDFVVTLTGKAQNIDDFISAYNEWCGRLRLLRYFAWWAFGWSPPPL